MELFKVFALLAVLQTTVTSSDDNQLIRLRRDAESIATSIDRLKMVARVAAGIQLTQDLITGTAKTDEMASELLKINPVTPTQIAALDTTALEAAITGLTNLMSSMSTLNLGAKKNAMILAETKAALTGLNNFKDWPEKTSFDSTLTGIKTSGIDLSFAKKLKDEANALGVSFNNAFGAGKIGQLQTHLDLLKTRTSNLINQAANPTFPKFSVFGTAGELFSKVNKLLAASKVLSKFDKSVDSSSNALIGNMLNSYFTAGAQVDQVASMLAVVESTVRGITAPGVSRNLDYTYGLFEGCKDIDFVFADVNSHWMSPIVKSSHFEKAMAVLRKLVPFSTRFNSRFGRLKSNDLDTFTGIIEIVRSMHETSSKSAETLAALQALNNLSPIKDPPSNLDAIEQIAKLINELDALINPFAKEADDAVTFLKTTVAANLTQFVSFCTQAQDPGAVLTDLKTKLQEFKGLKIAIDTWQAPLAKNDNLAPIKAKAAEIDTSVVQQFLAGLNDYSITFGELSAIANLELIGDAVKNVDKLRNMTGSSSFARANTVVASIGASKSDMTSLKRALDGIKGKRSKESDALDLLQNSKKTVESIGKAVKAVVTMDEVFRRRADVQVVIQNIDLVTSEIPNGFDPTDKATLSVLVNSKPQFTAMESSIATWHTAVKDVLLEKLTDGDKIFTPSTKVTGVSGDLAPMVTALEHLIEKVPASPNIANLKSLKSSLSTLSTLQLDFASSRVPLDTAGASFAQLNAFFTAFGSKMGSKSKTSNEGEDGSNVGMTGTTSGIPTWGIVAIVAGCATVAVLIFSPVAFFIRKKLKDRADKKTKDRNKNDLYVSRDTYMKDGVKQNAATDKQVPVETKDNKPEKVPMKNIVDFIHTLMRLVEIKTEKKKAKQKKQIAEDEVALGCAPKTIYDSFFKEMLELAGGMENNHMKLVDENKQYTKFEKIGLVPKTRVIAEGVPNGFFHGNMIEYPGGPPLLAFQSPIASGDGKVDTRTIMWNVMRKQNVQHILMFSNFNTKQADECAEHFGQRLGEIFKMPRVTTTTTSLEKGECLDCYHLKVEYFDEKEKLLDSRNFVVHHYTTFPPTKAPKITAPLIDMFKKVEKTQQPIGIHCASGVGPTGVAVYCLVARRALAKSNFNMFSLLTELREKRAGLIETSLQLAFCVNIIIDHALANRKLEGNVLNQYNQLFSLYNVLYNEGDGIFDTKSVPSNRSEKINNDEDLEWYMEHKKQKDEQMRAKYPMFHNYSKRALRGSASEMGPSKEETVDNLEN